MAGNLLSSSFPGAIQLRQRSWKRRTEPPPPSLPAVSPSLSGNFTSTGEETSARSSPSTTVVILAFFRTPSPPPHLLLSLPFAQLPATPAAIRAMHISAEFNSEMVKHLARARAHTHTDTETGALFRYMITSAWRN